MANQRRVIPYHNKGNKRVSLIQNFDNSWGIWCFINDTYSFEFSLNNVDKKKAIEAANLFVTN